MSAPGNIRVNLVTSGIYGDIVMDPNNPDFTEARVYLSDDIETMTNKNMMDFSNNIASNYIRSGQSYLRFEDTGFDTPEVGTVLTVKNPGILGFMPPQGSSGGSGVLSVNGKTGIISINQDDVNLGNVDNTNDYSKPVSIYQQIALDQKLDTFSYGVPNGTASLDSTGKLRSSQLPNSVLSGIQFGGTWDASTGLPNFGNATNANKGTIYIVSVSGTTLLNGSLQDFDVGDEVISNGVFWEVIKNSMYVSSVNGHTGGVILGKNDVNLGNVDNTSDINKPVSAAVQEQLDLKMNKGDVINTLSYGDPIKPLSSAMGYQINALKLAIADVTDSLTSTSQNKPLSANMGNVLNGMINDRVKIGDLNGIVEPMIDGKVNALSNDVIHTSLVGQNNGIAPLDNTGKIALSYLPGSVVGVMSWRGTWDASLNIPLIPSASGNSGDMYQCTIPGTQSINGYPQSFSSGEWIISNGTIWEIVPSSVSVSSVNNKIGNVFLNSGDVGLGNVDNTSDMNKPVSTSTQSALDMKVNISSIVDSLTSSDPNSVLSANQGSILQSSKVNISDIVNNLVTSGDNVPLSATQGMILQNNKIDKMNITSSLVSTDSNSVLSAAVGPMITSSLMQKINIGDIVNNLTSNDSTKVLSASQGKILNDSKMNKSSIYVGLDGNDPSKVLASTTGSIIQDLLDQKLSASNIMNDLSSGDPTKILGMQGAQMLIPKSNIVTSLSVSDPGSVLGAPVGQIINTSLGTKINYSDIMTDPNNPSGKSVVSSSLWPNVLLKTNIVDSLDVNDPNSVLSAAQGYLLQNSKVNKIDVENDLLGTEPGRVLSAAQGPVLSNMIAGKLGQEDIVNSLLSNDSTKVLGASQGPVIYSMISTKLGQSDVIDSLLSNDPSKPLSANQGQILGNSKIDINKISSTLINSDPGSVLSGTVGNIINTKFGDYVLKANIVNNLTTTDTNKILSASTGQVITNYVNETVTNGLSGTVKSADIVNSLTDNSQNKVLGANQGPVLSNMIAGKLGQEDIVNSLLSTDSTKTLSASQGPILSGMISSKIDQGSIVNNILSNDPSKVLGANQGPVLSNMIASKLGQGDIINSLLSNDSSKVLAASQGPVLSSMISSLSSSVSAKLGQGDIVNSLLSNDSTKTLGANQGPVLSNMIASKLGQGDIVNTLSSNDSSKVLGANQGPVISGMISLLSSSLSSLIDTKVSQTDIENSLTSNDPSRVLGANQGPVISGMISSLSSNVSTKLGQSDIENSLMSNDSSRVLSASQGLVLNDMIAIKLGQDSIENSLVGTDLSKVLGASQGPILNGMISSLSSSVSSKLGQDSIENSLSSNDSSKVLGADQGPILNDIISTKIGQGDIENSLTSNDPNKVLAASQGPILLEMISSISGSELSLYDIDKNYPQDSSVILNDEIYMSNSQIPPETPFILGTSSGTWRKISDQGFNSDQERILDMTNALSHDPANPTDIRSIAQGNKGKFVVSKINSYVQVNSGPGILLNNLSMLYSDGLSWTLIDRPLSGRWNNSVNYSASDLNELSGKDIQENDFCSLSCIPRKDYIYKDGSWTPRDISDVVVDGEYPFVNPSLLKIIRGQNGSVILSWPDDQDESYDIYVSTTKGILGNPELLGFSGNTTQVNIIPGMTNYFYIKRNKAMSGNSLFIPDLEDRTFPISFNVVGKKIFTSPGQGCKIILSSSRLSQDEELTWRIPFDPSSNVLDRDLRRLTLNIPSSPDSGVFDLSSLFGPNDDTSFEFSSYLWAQEGQCEITDPNSISRLGLVTPGSTFMTSEGYTSCKNVSISSDQTSGLLSLGLKSSSLNSGTLSMIGKRGIEILVNPESQGTFDLYLTNVSVSRGIMAGNVSANMIKVLSGLPDYLLSIKILGEYYSVLSFDSVSGVIKILYNLDPVVIPENISVKLCVAQMSLGTITKKKVHGLGNTNALCLFNTGLCLVKNNQDAMSLNGYTISSDPTLGLSGLYVDNSLRISGSNMLPEYQGIPNSEYMDMSNFGIGKIIVQGSPDCVASLDSYNPARISEYSLDTSLEIMSGPYCQNMSSSSLNIWQTNSKTYVPESSDISCPVFPTNVNVKVFDNLNPINSMPSDEQWTQFVLYSDLLSTQANNPWANNDPVTFGQVLKYTYLSIPGVLIWYDAAVQKLVWMKNSGSSWSSISLEDIGINDMNVIPSSFGYDSVLINSDSMNTVQVTLGDKSYTLDFYWPTDSIVKVSPCPVMSFGSWSSGNAMNSGSGMPNINGRFLIFTPGIPSKNNGDGTFSLYLSLSDKLGQNLGNISDFILMRNALDLGLGTYGQEERNMTNYGWCAGNMPNSNGMCILIQDPEPIFIKNILLPTSNTFLSWISLNIPRGKKY